MTKQKAKTERQKAEQEPVEQEPGTIADLIQSMYSAFEKHLSSLLCPGVGERPPCREREGVVPRLDGLCYDNSNVQVERKLQLPKGPRPRVVCLCNNIENAHVAMRLRKSPMLWVGERPPCREREGVVPRLDGLCYDNTNVQVESGEGEKVANAKRAKDRRPMQLYYNIENAQVEG